MKHLFAYGTLMCREIMAGVCGLDVQGEPASLSGFRRMCVKDECYPALVRCDSIEVDGILYRDIPRSAWNFLDRFEGEMYEREEVDVLLQDNSVIPAATYVARAEFHHCLEDREWDYAAFLRDSKDSFCTS